MKQVRFRWPGLVMLLLLAGCVAPPSPWREVVTQVSTYDALREGRFEGQMAYSNLVAYGDTGMGTFEGLDGEMVMLDGVAYRAGHDGKVVAMPPASLVPFATVTWFDADQVLDSGPFSQQVFLNTMKWKNQAPDQVQAVQVNGVFKHMRLRSVPKQQPPYPPLSEIVPGQQRVWDHQDIRGTLVGFCFPQNSGGLALAGYHLHFLSEDRQVGGHVLDFELTAGRISLDNTPVFQVFLPPMKARDAAAPAGLGL